MIGAVEHNPGRKLVADTVSKGIVFHFYVVIVAAIVEERLKPYFAQAQDDLQVWQVVYLGRQVPRAVVSLLSGRFIAWGNTFHGNGHVASDLKPIVSGDRLGLVREADSGQTLEQKISRLVSCKHSPGSVAPVCSRSQAKDSQFRLRIAIAWDRLSPVVPVHK